MTYRAHEAAWKAAVASATGYAAYTLEEVPTPIPGLYTLVFVTRRAVDVMRFSAGRATLGWRLQTKSVASTRDDVQLLRERIATNLSDRDLAAIESTRLLPDGDADEPELDEKYGRWTALDSWIYYAPNPPREEP